MKSTAQGNKLYRCRYAGCTKEFKSRTGRRSHEKVKHEGKKQNCDEPGCKKEFRGLSALVSHKRAKHDKIPFRCNYPDCTREFESRNGRNKHRNRDHANAEGQGSLLSTPGNGALSRGARWQRDQPRQPRQAAATILNPPAAASSHELLILTSAPEAEDGGQRRDPGRNFKNNPALTRHMRSCGKSENNEGSPPGAEPQYQLQQAAMRNPHQVLNAQPAGQDAPALESQASLTYSGEVSWIYTPNEPTRHRGRSTPGDDIVRLASELDHSKEASAMASVPAATDPRSLTTRSGMTLGGEDEEAGSPAPSYPDGIQSPGSRASWPGRYGSSIHVLDELPDHLRNKSPMADPPETGFSDEDDARSCTTLAGEEDRRSLTPAPVSGRPFRRAYRQGFEGNGARTRNTREQRDISELAVNLEMEHVDQDQGQGANATLHSPIATQPHQPIHSRLPRLQAPQKAPQATPSQFVCSGYGQCQKQFNSNGSLTRHINFSHNKTGVTCDKCGMLCRAPWDLQQHKKNKHGEGGKLPCGQCKRTFSRESLRLQHVKRIHGGA